MIRPTKYMRLEQCVLRVVALLLSHLRSVAVLPMSEVEGLVGSRLGDPARINVLDALNVLFLLGLIDYDVSSDMLVYTRKAT